ncbi:GIY-YIG nuclease family protein [Alicyclobacillus herbarius]|uniref:GIY-YIG nuclease family protein n=1 Tax=Alicyclobacillus herbarius TaxID=122960 RepID=UPI0003F9AE67|nr:GIY-YIG nuclease family protein [Alicyclobacillus herbarius]
MNYVYMLECGDGTIYTGWTTDLARRLAAHRAGRGARYTRGRGPLIVRRVEVYADKSAALRREREIKRLNRADKLALLAEGPTFERDPAFGDLPEPGAEPADAGN